MDLAQGAAARANRNLSPLPGMARAETSGARKTPASADRPPKPRREGQAPPSGPKGQPLPAADAIRPDRCRARAFHKAPRRRPGHQTKPPFPPGPFPRPQTPGPPGPQPEAPPRLCRPAWAASPTTRSAPPLRPTHRPTHRGREGGARNPTGRGKPVPLPALSVGLCSGAIGSCAPPRRSGPPPGDLAHRPAIWPVARRGLAGLGAGWRAACSPRSAAGALAWGSGLVLALGPG